MKRHSRKIKQKQKSQVVKATIGAAITIQIIDIIFTGMSAKLGIMQKQERVIICDNPFATCSKPNIHATAIDKGLILVDRKYHLKNRK